MQSDPHSFSSIQPCINGSKHKLVEIQDRLTFALISEHQARDLLRWRMRFICIVNGADSEVTEDGCEFENQPPGLATIHRFVVRLWQNEAYKQGKTMVVCAGMHPESIRSTALMVGAFMILSLGKDVADVVGAFKPLSKYLTPYDDQVSVESCWRALYKVHAERAWLMMHDELHDMGFFKGAANQDCGNEEAIHMDEYAHYDSPLNGGFHVVVPGELLAFDSPSDLPDGALWADAGGVRRFSAAFYADIFADMGVDVVVRGSYSSYDAAAFTGRGIGVEDLPTRGDAPSLGQIDRFLQLARKAPGMVAVHGGAGGLGSAAVLVAVWLMSAHGFRAAEALAWVRMAHPAGGGLSAAQRRLLVDREARTRRRWTRTGRFSHSFCHSVRGHSDGHDAAAGGAAGVRLGLRRSESAPSRMCHPPLSGGRAGDGCFGCPLL
jgi:hypothetical protein